MGRYAGQLSKTVNTWDIASRGMGFSAGIEISAVTVVTEHLTGFVEGTGDGRYAIPSLNWRGQWPALFEWFA
jgi:hypothetical protein